MIEFMKKLALSQTGNMEVDARDTTRFPSTISMSVGMESEVPFTLRNEYFIAIEYKTRLVCSPSELPQAKADAAKLVAREVYGEICERVMQAVFEIEYGDFRDGVRNLKSLVIDIERGIS